MVGCIVIAMKSSTGSVISLPKKEN